MSTGECKRAARRPAALSRPLLVLLGAGLLAAAAWVAWGLWRPAPTPEDGGPDAPPWFEDVTDEVGLDFVHDAGPTGAYFMPQVMGSGAALFDADGDGHLDVYLVHNGGPRGKKNRLYRQRDGLRFEDVSADSGLDVAGHGMGVAVGDVDNDGRPDVLLTEYRGARLFWNAGGFRFVDVTASAGIDNPLWGSSAAFLDYDRDGRLDLVVVNYVDYDPARRCGPRTGERDFCHPNSFPGSVARLYRNRSEAGRAPATRVPGKGVRFEDATFASGLAAASGNGLGVVCADFTGDRWPDLFVANDAQPNRLWVNQRDGTFRDEAVVRGVAYDGLGQARADMGVALGDVDGDGLLDLFATHLTEELHTLWRQEARGLFQDRTGPSGLAAPGWRGTGFGTVLGDFDQDGDLDLAIANGRVSRDRMARPGAGPFSWDAYAERNQLFANDGRGRFRDVSPGNGPFCGTPRLGRGLAVGDVDGDGALDLLVCNVAGPARLYRNAVPGRGRGLLVRAVDPSLGGRDACGAEVTVRAGGRSWRGLINPGHSYQCSNDPRAHFGLGTVRRVDAIEVVWPDGSEETFPGAEAGAAVLLRKGQGRPARGDGGARS